VTKFRGRWGEVEGGRAVEARAGYIWQGGRRQGGGAGDGAAVKVVNWSRYASKVLSGGGLAAFVERRW
jgi:hypothetical protein